MTRVAELLDGLGELLGPQGLWTEEADRRAYEQGWRYGRGRALAVARPRTPEEVCEVLARCQRAGVRVQPMGANTGLVGASNPDASGEQLVLSLERLSATIEIDPVDRTVLVDAGVTLSALNEALRPHGLWFPVDLGADPQVGGMVATNTGGTRLVRHGDVRRHLLGLEVALPDGSLWSRLRRLRKDNTGLDWKQLFVGTSGTFGVVTRAVLSVSPLPRATTAVLAACEDGAAVLRLLAAVERELGEVLSAFEVLSGGALEAVLRHGVEVRDPFPDARPGYTVLVELSSALPPGALDLDALLLGALEPLLESDDGLHDVVVGEASTFWHLRHQVSESLAHEGNVLALDLSVPRSALPRLNAEVRELLAREAPGARLCDFGHWGDGGTHLNLVLDRDGGPEPGGEAWRSLQESVYALCVDGLGGSYSAEHGVGPHNLRSYRTFTPEPVRELCRRLEAHFDPGQRLGTVDLG